MENTDAFMVASKVSALQNTYRFSICTFVTERKQYQDMMNSFIISGFTTDKCEYRYIDNIGKNSFEAYQGINLFLQQAQGEYIVLCHQDVLLNFDDIQVLEQRIEEITAQDNTWAILSNAGGIENDLFNRCTINVSYADGWYHREGTFPQKVSTVDEHFIVVKRSANLALSANLSGFHLYGTDICLIAELLGHTAYVIDFKLTHLSYGSPDESYYALLDKLRTKYVHFMRSRRIITTITDFFLSASASVTQLAESKWGKKLGRKAAKYRFRKKWPFNR